MLPGEGVLQQADQLALLPVQGPEKTGEKRMKLQDIPHFIAALVASAVFGLKIHFRPFWVDYF